MNTFEKKVFETVNKFNMFQPGDKVVVGLSGGADSCALLTSLKILSEGLGIKLVAAHLNHGIRGDEAERDMRFSGNFAANLKVEFVSKTICVPEYAKEHKISLEMAGRRLRYEYFNELCMELGCNKIAVAHNKNDRVETILMNLIRGSGSNGLNGIKPVNGITVRPLIEISREEIEDYSVKSGFEYMTDSTNNEDVYARNIVRNKLLCEMKKINPNVVDNIIRTSDIIYSECSYIDSLCFDLCKHSTQSNIVSVDRKAFEKLNIVLKRRILLNAITILCKTTQNIVFRQIESAIRGTTGNVFSVGNGVSLIYTSNELIFTTDNIDISSYEYKISLNQICYIKETGISYKIEETSEYKKAPDTLYISGDNLNLDSLYIRTRMDGDVFQPSGLSGSKKVKKFYIDSKIPIHRRNMYPLLVFKNEVLAILPLRVNENFKVNNNTKKILKISILGGTYDKK